MRFTSILVAGAVAVVASAQGTATSTGSTPAATAPVSPVVQCLNNCKFDTRTDVYNQIDTTNQV